MADAATSDWSTGSAGGSWTAPPQGMWGGMQSPYASPWGGGGYGMPYGGMPSPYGGYGMQSPYGAPTGYSPYGMQSPYSAYGMPSMMAAPQTMAAAETGGVTPPAEVDPRETLTKLAGGLDISGSQNTTTTFEPWQYQAGMLRSLYQGEVLDKEGKVEPWSKGLKGAADIIREQQALGPLGFDPSSEAGLRRMEQLAGGANPQVGSALNATQDIASGQQGINTGGMFGSMYDHPGITGQEQYQDMAHRDAIGNTSQYNQMIGRDSIGNASQYNQLYGGMQGAGSLAGGRYGQVASGDLMNANPYREQAIQQAMGDTADQVKATMSSRGRFGSDAYGDAMGRALGQVATQARMQGYDTDTANMMAAAQGRSGEALARGGLGLQAAQGLSSLQGTNAAQRLAQIQGLSGIQGQNYQAKLGALGQMNAAQQMAAQQRMAAAQGLTGVQGSNIANRLQAAGMAPAMQNLRYDDANRQLQAGAAREAMAQQQRDFGWNQLNQYRSQIGNLPGTAGSQTAEGANKPWWETALGLGASAAGMWGGMGQ